MDVKLTIDGKTVAAEKGKVLVDVIRENGVYIPTLCYPEDGSVCLGTCRACMCRVNGWEAASCAVEVQDGMTVEVEKPDLARMRKTVVEMMFSEGKHNCPSCEKSGSCDLQAVGYETGMLVSEFPYRFPVTEPESASEKIWLERDRCILCQRCVEMVHDEKTGQKIFSNSGRGTKMRIEIDPELADQMTDEQVQYAVDLCPVGCILRKGHNFERPIGQRKFEVRSIRDRALENTKR